MIPFWSNNFISKALINRLDRNRYDEGLLLYVSNNINAALLKRYTFPGNIEAFFIEILMKSCKFAVFMLRLL